MGAFVHDQDVDVTSSKIVPSFGVSFGYVCPSPNSVDVSHISTSMFQKKSMKKMLPSICASKPRKYVFAMDSEFAMDFDDNFWKLMFDKKLLKHKDRLNVIFVWFSLFLLNPCFPQSSQLSYIYHVRC
jgi:hypothetical protein